MLIKYSGLSRPVYDKAHYRHTIMNCVKLHGLTLVHLYLQALVRNLHIIFLYFYIIHPSVHINYKTAFHCLSSVRESNLPSQLVVQVFGSRTGGWIVVARSVRCDARYRAQPGSGRFPDHISLHKEAKHSFTNM